MNMRAIVDLTKKLDQAKDDTLKYIQKRNEAEAKISSTLQMMETHLEMLNHYFSAADEKKTTLSNKEYAVYVEKLIMAIYSDLDSRDSDSENDEIEFTLLSRSMETLINIKKNRQALGIENESKITDLIDRLSECQRKLWNLLNLTHEYQLTKATQHVVKHPSDDSSNFSNSEDDRNHQAPKRKIEEVSVSATPDTLFASNNKKQKREIVPTETKSERSLRSQSKH